MSPEPQVPTWLWSDRRLARLVGRPLNGFLDIEASGGVLLLGVTIVALAWANSPWDASYTSLWHTVVTVRFGDLVISHDLRHWVNGGLMTLFFFVVGLEVKRELTVGELRRPAAALLPAVAAVGGMIVPALIYLAFNAGGVGARGWGIPMATDIAFALALFTVLGRRIPPPLKLFLLTLAIVDDVGSIIVIAVVYTHDLALVWLGVAVLLCGVIALLRRAHVWYLPVYVLLGIAVWLATWASGIQPTIASVVLGLLTPARPFQREPEAESIVDQLEGRDDLTAEDVRAVSFEIRESVSVVQRLELALHPWTSFVVLPIFALANAGVVLSLAPLADGSPVVWGIIVGRIVGKVVGVTLFAWLITRVRGVDLPEGVTWLQIAGTGAVAGIGFSVALYIRSLVFRTQALQQQATLGILLSAVIAAGVGTLILTRAHQARGNS